MKAMVLRNPEGTAEKPFTMERNDEY